MLAMRLEPLGKDNHAQCHVQLVAETIVSNNWEVPTEPRRLRASYIAALFGKWEASIADKGGGVARVKRNKKQR